METFLAVSVGVGLAAACGFRVFVPMLIAGLAARTDILHPAADFAWIGSSPALIAFGVACVAELAAYYIPWFDNLFDVAASPLAMISGILLSAAMLGDVSPLLQWSLAIIAGGGAAAVVQGGTVVSRLSTTTTTGGTANFILTTLETVASVFFSLLSIFIPVASICLLIVVVATMYVFGRAVVRRLFRRGRGLN